MPDRIQTNIEDLFSYLIAQLPWLTDSEKFSGQSVFAELVRLIDDIFEEFESRHRFDNDHMIKLIEYWYESETIITTFNYDTITEKYYYEHLKCKLKILVHNVDGNQCAIYCRRVRKNDDRPKIQYNANSKQLYIHFHVGFREMINGDSLAEFLDQIDHQDEYKSLPQSLQQFVSSLSIKLISDLNRPAQLTYLYQLPLINILGRSGIGVFGGEKEPTFRYFKLHGSRNWHYSGDNEKANDPIYFEPFPNQDYTEDRQGLLPVIIPPVLNKDRFYDNVTLAVQWREALKNASDHDVNSLFFIGYSMPLSDSSVRYFFNRALSRKSSMPTVSIVNDLRTPEQKATVLRNYLLSLTSLNPEQVEQWISDASSKMDGEADNIRFDWSLSLLNGNEHSTAEKLVKYFDSQ